jgi:putative ABC transport system permease protein
MGAGSGTLVGMIVLQSIIVGLIGYGIGAGGGSLVGYLGGRGAGKLAFYTPYQLLIISFAATMLICVLSSLLSIQRGVAARTGGRFPRIGRG